MPASDTIPDHVQWMGKLIVDLQSLEFALRAFLYNCERGWTSQGGPSFLDNIEEEQRVELNAFTNDDQLKDLVEKYNCEVESKGIDLKVDPSVVRIRDALAHGRVSSRSPSPDKPLSLVKYSKPKRGDSFVQGTDGYILTKEWFDEKIKWVAKNTRKVLQANDSFGHV